MAGAVLLFDLGGVVLTNGWDRHARSRAVQRFGLDPDDFAERHEAVSSALETGRMSFSDYLDCAVFSRERSFSREDFLEFVYSQSEADAEVLSLLAELASRPDLLLGTLNNESRELNEYRIRRFELTRYFKLFLTSSYLGVMKPDEKIYRLALDLTQQRPERCLFIDDRDLNVEASLQAGLPALLFTNADALRGELVRRGFLEA
jgi:putative hydrolase of the HAD superfamily